MSKERACQTDRTHQMGQQDQVYRMDPEHLVVRVSLPSVVAQGALVVQV